jgi:hypothetical protein
MVEVAGQLEKQLRRASDSALSDDERQRFDDMLDVAGVGEPFSTFVFMVATDQRLARQGEGRCGAPARDNMRDSLRALHTALCRVVHESERRDVVRCIAYLIMLHGVDTHGTFWRRTGHPPTGAARVRWLVRRLTDLLDDGAGQYEARLGGSLRNR